MLKGFDCTIFAYGQTGTGKTYTMSGDISDHILPPEGAGIIPRVLHSLFLKLGSLSDPPVNAAPEKSVKVSFIELYNEEIRDLLSAEDKYSLKILDGDSKRGAATVVQGMEEQYITSARKGIQLLRSGSHKRQVAATKCNDLSSRSHTVFTITVYHKRMLPSGEELLSSGKLNLVDLAGSENIGRSGAENKEAVEAGLVNRSLLALGRVINARVERSAHVPYRESKLTRLLQDSLGGRAKTCIIVTISPVKSSLAETVSSLDYAFRAKNVRNKPQTSSLVPGKTPFKKSTTEMGRLGSELIATQQRNEQLINESELHRILLKEQRGKIEMIESRLELMGNFDILKKDSEATKGILDRITSMLEDTKAELAHMRRMLDEEALARQQHERTEEQLTSLNHELLATLGQLTNDNKGVHLKLQRRLGPHAENRADYIGTRQDVVDITSLVKRRLDNFREEQQLHVDAFSEHMHAFTKHELDKLDAARADLGGGSTACERSHGELAVQTAQSKEDLNQVLNRVKAFKEEIEKKLGEGLNDLGAAVRRISEGIMAGVEIFQDELPLSCSNFTMDLKTTFDDMSREINEQREEMQRLRDEVAKVNQQLQQSQPHSVNTLLDPVDQERTVGDRGNKDLTKRTEKLFEDNALDTAVGRTQEQNNTAHAAQGQSCSTLASTAQDLYANSDGTFTVSFNRIKDSSSHAAKQADGSREILPYLDKEAHRCNQSTELGQRVEQNALEEHVRMEQTPTRKEYSYPAAAPRTGGRDTVRERMCIGRVEDEPSSYLWSGSPSKAPVLMNNHRIPRQQAGNSSVVRLSSVNSVTNLRELDVNTMNNTTNTKNIALSEKDNISSNTLTPLPLLKRPAPTSISVESKVPIKKRRPRSPIAASKSLTTSSTIAADRRT